MRFGICGGGVFRRLSAFKNFAVRLHDLSLFQLYYAVGILFRKIRVMCDDQHELFAGDFL